MSPTLRSELEVALYAARRARDGARWRVSPLKAEIAQVHEEINAITTEIAELNAAHDQQQRLADRRFNQRRFTKAHQKVGRRNELGADLKNLRAKRERRRVKLAGLEAQYEAHMRLHHVYELNEAYVVARHNLLKAIAEQECDDTARQLKVARATAAEIPEPYLNAPDTIWYYEEPGRDGAPNEIHLFYGGTIAPTGIGESPDGNGHGHHILEVHGTNYVMNFFRLPGGGRPE